ncbi:MAG: TolC family protein [bacterium]
MKHRQNTMIGFLGMILWAGAALGSTDSPQATADRFLDSFLGSKDAGGTEDGVPRELLALALERNPDLAAAESRLAAAGAAAEASGSLPDPRLGYSENLQPIETRLGPQVRAVTLSQSFPWFGTLGAMADMKRAAVAGARAERDQVALGILTRTRETYHELAYLDTAMAITRDHQRLVADLDAVVQARFAAGQAGLADVLKIQKELGTLANDLASLQDRRPALLAALEAAVGIPVDPRDHPPAFSGAAAVAETATIDLTSRLAASNPQLRIWSSRMDGFRSAGTLAAKQGLPAFTLGLQYLQVDPRPESMDADNGRDAFGLAFGMTLPLWRGKVDAARQEAAGNLQGAASRRQAVLLDLQRDLERERASYRNARRSLQLHDSTLLPLARQALAVTRSAYEAGRTGYLDLIDAQRDLLSFERARARAAADLNVHRARIEGLIAGPLVGPADPNPKGE